MCLPGKYNPRSSSGLLKPASKWEQAIITAKNRLFSSQVQAPEKSIVKPVLLWIGNAPGGAELSAHPLCRYSSLFSNAGLQVKFLFANFQREDGIARELGALGVETLSGEWFRNNYQQWLEDHAQAIEYVVFDQNSPVSEFILKVQQKTRAAVIYVHAGEEPDGFSSRACDILISDTEAGERDMKSRFPDKKIYFLPPSEPEIVGHSKENQSKLEYFLSVLERSRDEAALRIARSKASAMPDKRARLIAFYLPQYHPIPENDEWWGEGFTEWRNVRKTKPLFSGHYQPHDPADLGYYDLRDEDTRIAQAELARQYGIEGFCYYHYWFEGKRLLEGPLNDLLASGKPDFPFCLCWANESWSRRWDGRDQDILMRQGYSKEDDIAHIRSLIPVFKDPRYIRINGKPLFLVYRSESLPDPAATAATWREEARKAGLGELYLCRVESFVKGAPEEFGFDASLEFAPDWWNKGPRVSSDSELYKQADKSVKTACDNNYIHSYQGLSEAMLAKDLPDYKWFRCVTPSWDNWARRHEGASVFLDSTPDYYRAWLTACIDYSNLHLHGEERIVFINAWNEWAEGNHLEPDQRFGHAYLEATSQALLDGQVIAELRKLYAQDERHMIRLSRQVVQQENQLNISQQQLGDIISSTSWRITAPVRWVKQKLLDWKT